MINEFQLMKMGNMKCKSRRIIFIIPLSLTKDKFGVVMDQETQNSKVII